jgi:hypothetical protein
MMSGKDGIMVVIRILMSKFGFNHHKEVLIKLIVGVVKQHAVTIS